VIRARDAKQVSDIWEGWDLSDASVARRRPLWAKSVTYVLGTNFTYVSVQTSAGLARPEGFEPPTYRFEV
jgi:hypothetical protein